ncbi:MAG: ferredoxin--NADP reductase [Candidatus Nanohaloarchaea archaeon]
MSWDTATLESWRKITPEVKQFLLRLENDEWDFKPGQHTHIRFDKDGEEVVRPYTPTNLPGEDRFTLAIKRYEDGNASVWMHDREIGDEVEVEEPEGNLYIRDYDRDAVFISTGTGATPMFVMLKDYLENGSGKAWYFHGEKTREHLLFQETLDQLEAEHPELEVVYSLSDESWSGREGHIQEHLPEVLDSFDDRIFYVCGVPQAVVDAEELLKDRGVEEERIVTEGWEEDAT